MATYDEERGAGARENSEIGDSGRAETFLIRGFGQEGASREGLVDAGSLPTRTDSNRMDKKGSFSAKGTVEGRRELEFASLPAVVFVEGLGKDPFLPATCEFPELMLPVNGVPIMSYTLEMLHRNGVTEVYLLTCKHGELLSEYVDKYRSENRRKTRSMAINVIRLGVNCATLGDAFRELDFQIDLRDDFILIQGSVLSVADLRETVQSHKKKRLNSPNVAMTLLFMESPPLSSLRDQNDEKVVMYDSRTHELIYWSEFKNNKLSKSVDLSMKTLLRNSLCGESVVRYDLLDVGMAICSPQVLKVFCETFDYNDLFRDYVLNSILTDIKQDVIQIEVLTKYTIRICNLRTYHIALRDICQGSLFPLITDYSSTSCNKIQRYQGLDVFVCERTCISGKSKLAPIVSVGKGSKIGDGTSLEDSFIGENCVIGDNCSIRGCVILNNVRIFDNSNIQYSFIGNNVVVNASVTAGPYCIFASDVIIAENSTVGGFTRISRRMPKVNGDEPDAKTEKDSANTVSSDLRRRYRLCPGDCTLEAKANEDTPLSPNGVVWPDESRNGYACIEKILSDVVLLDQFSGGSDKKRQSRQKHPSYSGSESEEGHYGCGDSDGGGAGSGVGSRGIDNGDSEYEDGSDFEKLDLNCRHEFGSSGDCGRGEDREFAHECYSLVKSGLSNPVHISNKILELKGLRFAFFKDDLDILSTIIPLSLDLIYSNSGSFTGDGGPNNSINIEKFSEYCEESGISELINAFNRYENEEYTHLICNKLLVHSSVNDSAESRIEFGSLLVSFEKLEFINQSFILDWYDSLLEAQVRAERADSKLLSLLKSDFVLRYIEWLRED
ncbi:translation initiation factor EIF-2B epsilon subunit [Cryptosporidium ryanae]|uniref:translation initiation factor EIF-2B epsilon subunit n=1 Tax=Cryptosporidium ryanae TaxID=515981 RepID=UPI00351A621C|nr:translation initiation factor EIF-2B epsilon subunit [Cryptosporidium ryanae]